MLKGYNWYKLCSWPSSWGFTGFKHVTNQILFQSYFLDEHTNDKLFLLMYFALYILHSFTVYIKCKIQSFYLLQNNTSCKVKKTH